FLLEVLEENTVSIPELGPFKATVPPLVILTSNRTREVHDALKRRCLYHFIAHPRFEREVEIVRRKAPKASEALARQVATLMGSLRSGELVKLVKPPGVAESIDLARAAVALGELSLRSETVEAALGVFVKHEDDAAQVRRILPTLFPSQADAPSRADGGP